MRATQAAGLSISPILLISIDDGPTITAPHTRSRRCAAAGMAQAHILEDDKSALLDIFVWLFLVSGVLGVIVEAATKLIIRRRLGAEDYLILVSLAFAVGQSVCVSVQVANGLGKHLDVLGDSQRETIFKAEYTSNLLFVLCLCFTKLSLTIFIKNVAVIKFYQYAAYVLAAFTILWTVSSMFVFSFQCGLPQPWNYLDNRCIDRKTFGIYFGIMNIVTDLGPIVLMMVLASRIQTSIGRKLTIAGVFGSRIAVIAAVVCQLYYMIRATPTSDPTFDLWPAWICTQLVLALAIITTCIPYLKPFMDSLESGGYRADDTRRRGTNGYGSYNNTDNSGRPGAKSAGSKGLFSLRSSNNNSRDNLSGNRRQRQRRHTGGSHELGIMDNMAHLHGVTGTRVERSPSNDWDDERNSESSQSRIIKETKTFTVDVERI
ncbi:hypothetical protein FQN54_008708 [Arachnomyces sp. PD_36]|nr:hypothetical protein FQN54_008708 [Arachnomyces sp. PD_36]